MIPDGILKTVCATALGLTVFDAEVFEAHIIHIDACSRNFLRFHFYDESGTELTWKDLSRSESWTSEMREAARQKLYRGDNDGKESTKNRTNGSRHVCLELATAAEEKTGSRLRSCFHRKRRAAKQLRCADRLLPKMGVRGNLFRRRYHRHKH